MKVGHIANHPVQENHQCQGGRVILGFWGWVGALPQISMDFLLRGRGGLPFAYFILKYPLVMLLINKDLECQLQLVDKQ